MNALGHALLLAHVESAPGPRDWSELARAWSFEPWLMLGLGLSAWCYWAGAREWRRRLAAPRALRRWEAGCFWTGWGTLAVALLSPLHPWGQVLFAAHMTQHELLMLVAAPLLVLGRPGVAFLFGLPRTEARQVARIFTRPPLARGVRVLSHSVVAWSVHAVALWTWHAPTLFGAALRHPLVHDLQHASFFGTALLFWWALWHDARAWRGGVAALFYLFTTMLHTGALGALLLFANHPLYPAYETRSLTWGLTTLQDQQLGGLIMWVPAGVVYVVAALLGVVGWLRVAERRAAAARFTLSPVR